MIDFDRFWAEPGCMPGLSREQTDAQLAQMGTWLQSLPGASGQFDRSLVPGLNPAPGVTGEQIAAWERDHSVSLPDLLRQAFARQDGGYLRENQLRVLPLAEIENPDDEFWEWACYEEQEVPDRGLIFRFAEDESGGTYLLNYGACERDQEPSVFVHYGDPGDLNRCSNSVTKFVSGLLETFDKPLFDWSETATRDAIARETIDLTPIHGGPAEKEQVLVRQAGAVILFVHETSPAGESYSRTTLPEPLLKEAAMLQPCRPAPAPTFSLMLQPERIDVIVALESQRTGDGRWKNSKSHGTPVCVVFESNDRGRLEALRRDLFGKKAADRVQAQEERQQKLQTALGSITPDERQAAMMQMMLQMREQFTKLHAADSPLPAGAPPQVAALSELLQQKLREVEQRAKDQVAKPPIGPEILRQFGAINPEILRLLRPGLEPDVEDEREE